MTHGLILSFTLGCTGEQKDVPDADDSGGDSADLVALVSEPEVCASPAVTLAATASGFTATTEHYALQIGGLDETESRNFAALAETAWEGYASFFAAEVDGPLEVIVSADEAGFEAALTADGLGEPEGAGGYYEPSNGRAYLFLQPTAYYSRVLLLHELTHQYQDHVSGTSVLPFWYVEGLAEALGRHHWDGDCLQLRVRPLLSWEDAAAAAQAELDAGAELSALLSGDNASRPLAQELVRMLSSEPDLAASFSTWRADVAAGASAADLDKLAATVAPIDELAEALTDWIPSDQESMTPIYLDWVPQSAGSAWGFADYSSAARVKEAVDSFSMVVDAPTDGESVGSVYGYDVSTGEMELAFVSADGSVSRFAVIGGAVTWDIHGSITLADEVEWSQSAGDTATTLTLGDTVIELPRTLPAAGGLSLYAADAVFDEIAWE